MVPQKTEKNQHLGQTHFKNSTFQERISSHQTIGMDSNSIRWKQNDEKPKITATTLAFKRFLSPPLASWEKNVIDAKLLRVACPSSFASTWVFWLCLSTWSMNILLCLPTLLSVILFTVRFQLIRKKYIYLESSMCNSFDNWDNVYINRRLSSQNKKDIACQKCLKRFVNSAARL